MKKKNGRSHSTRDDYNVYRACFLWKKIYFIRRGEVTEVLSQHVKLPIFEMFALNQNAKFTKRHWVRANEKKIAQDVHKKHIDGMPIRPNWYWSEFFFLCMYVVWHRKCIWNAVGFGQIKPCFHDLCRFFFAPLLSSMEIFTLMSRCAWCWLFIWTFWSFFHVFSTQKKIVQKTKYFGFSIYTNVGYFGSIKSSCIKIKPKITRAGEKSLRTWHWNWLSTFYICEVVHADEMLPFDWYFGIINFIAFQIFGHLMLDANNKSGFPIYFQSINFIEHFFIALLSLFQ